MDSISNMLGQTEVVLKKLEEWSDDYSSKMLHIYQHTLVEGMGQWFLKSKQFINWSTVKGPSRLICYGKRVAPVSEQTLIEYS